MDGRLSGPMVTGPIRPAEELDEAGRTLVVYDCG